MLSQFVLLLKRIVLGRGKSVIELIAEKCECGEPYKIIQENLHHVDIYLPFGKSELILSKSEFTKVSVRDGVNVKLPKRFCYNNGDCLEIRYLSKKERMKKERWINNYLNVDIEKSYTEASECL